MQTFAIDTQGLTKFSKSGFRVKNIDLKVPEGCVYGFLGPNGAGKTTTMKLLLGLIKADSGSIRFFGDDVTDANRFAMNSLTGSLIESPGYYGHLTGMENMEIIARYKGADADSVIEALKTVRLYEKRGQRVKEYSLGMKQRLGIAMALVGKPRILILDEPTNGLDPAGIQEIRNLIRDMPRSLGCTVIVSSHLLSEIEQMADHVGIIRRGEMIYQGTLAGLEKNGRSLEEVFLEMTGEGAAV